MLWRALMNSYSVTLVRQDKYVVSVEAESEEEALTMVQYFYTPDEMRRVNTQITQFTAKEITK
jgi:hypothetical protein